MVTDVPSILYVEDDPDTLRLVTLILGRKGFDVTGAMTGRDGLSRMRQTRPDLVLLDLMLPDIDGWEVFNRMKSDAELAEIPVIVVTARHQSLDKLLGLHLSEVREYLSKPFGPQQLVDTVQRVLLGDTSLRAC
ncbi:MAG: PleD family two-component system response regulator [Anaerolineae bacterium]